MDLKPYPVIDLVATGNNIRRLRMERGLTVRELQSYFGFDKPRAIYKWQKGESLPMWTISMRSERSLAFRWIRFLFLL